MVFAVCILVGIYLGRRIGWSLSRSILYPSSTAVASVVCLLWGAGVASLLRLSFNTFHPGLIVKILAYGAGGYISTPNFGLFLEGSIPFEIQPRHQLVTTLPFVAFVIASIVLAFVRR